MNVPKFFLAPLLTLTLANTVAAETIELEEAEVFIEWNSTDDEYGLHFFWEADAWTRMKVLNQKGKKVLNISPSKNTKRQGLVEGFLKTDEPDTSEMSKDAFLARFPAGRYKFKGSEIEGDRLVGVTELTHVLPAPPTNLFPADGADIDSTEDLTASFTPVTEDTDGNPITPVLYELVIEADSGPLNIMTLQVDGSESNPELKIPKSFLAPDTDYAFEVIVQEESGNRTVTEIEFSTF